MTTPYQLLPDLTAEEFTALKADIAAHGVLIPIEYDEDGHILDGHHRVRACTELGLSDWPRVTRTGMSEAEKRSHVRALNLHRRHLTAEQRRSLIADAVRETPERSNRQIAADLHVSHPTVSKVRTSLEESGDVERVSTTTDTLGREQPRRVEIQVTRSTSQIKVPHYPQSPKTTVIPMYRHQAEPESKPSAPVVASQALEWFKVSRSLRTMWESLDPDRIAAAMVKDSRIAARHTIRESRAWFDRFAEALDNAEDGATTAP